MNKLGGILDPKPFDGTVQDLVYGVDSIGRYLGLVPRAQAVAAADSAPRRGDLRWDGQAWVPDVRTVLLTAIEAELETRLNAGVQFAGRTYPTDVTFQQVVFQYLLLYAASAIAPMDTVALRATDGTMTNFNLTNLRALATVLRDHLQQAWLWAWTEKAKLPA